MEALWDDTNRHCDEGTVVHQEYRRSESVLNEETQSRDLPLCFTSLFNFSQVMDFFWAMDTS